MASKRRKRKRTECRKDGEPCRKADKSGEFGEWEEKRSKKLRIFENGDGLYSQAAGSGRQKGMQLGQEGSDDGTKRAAADEAVGGSCNCNVF